MPTVLVTGPTVTQNSPFSSLAAAVTIASTHFAYSRWDDQAELNVKTVYTRQRSSISVLTRLNVE